MDRLMNRLVIGFVKWQPYLTMLAVLVFVTAVAHPSPAFADGDVISNARNTFVSMLVSAVGIVVLVMGIVHMVRHQVAAALILACVAALLILVGATNILELLAQAIGGRLGVDTSGIQAK